MRILMSMMLFFLLFLPLFAEEGVVDIYFFYSTECSYCSEAHPFLQELAAQNPEIALHSFEISQERAFWEVFKHERDIHALSIPQIYIGDKVFFGFLDERGPLRRHKSQDGYIAYTNQILRAVEKETGRPVEGADPYIPRLFYAIAAILIFLLIFLFFRCFFC